ncbi:hypothetical protein L6164_031619 [Bauhinia variegata]|uniref:Uncharacterized protein n=1 Tax=Bauhinia variegata TaxID=167791 RepID=A0ACB9LG03_BAUVA|nr:hypothetical protein L6164_031619 [Bauhinia variegata]
MVVKIFCTEWLTCCYRGSKDQVGTTFGPEPTKKNPSAVRDQNGNFSVAFNKHEERYREEVKRWRDALTEVAGLSGWHSKNRYQSELTQEIVDVLWTKLQAKLPTYDDGFIGMNFDQPQSKSHEGRYREDKVKRWRDALKEVAGLPGWRSKDRYLSELTEEIVAVLLEKSLLTKYHDHGILCLGMHDILQEMGRNIVIRESINNVGKRSRLWLQEDIDHVLRKNKGSEFIQGIVLKSRTQKALWNPNAFSKICNLKLLMLLTTMDLPSGLNCLSEGLRYLEWENFPLEELPLREQLDELVELKMLRSKIKQPWHGKKSFRKLKLIDLRYSKELIRFPNVLEVPNLEQLILEDCINLLEVDHSVGQLKKLILLNLKGCVNLKNLPRHLEMDSLKDFILSGCSKVKKLPEFGDKMKNLTSLDLQDCKSLVCLPKSIEKVKSLRILNILGSSKFSRLPENLGENEALEELNVSGTAIKEVPPSIILLKGLKKLYIGGHREKESNSWSLSTLPSRLMFWRFPISSAIILPPLSHFSCLEELDLSYINLNNESLPVELGCLSSLWKLDLNGNNFVNLPASFGSLPKLYHLGLDCCPKLESVPILPPQIGSLGGRNSASWKPFSDPQYLCDFFASHQQVRSAIYTSSQEAPFLFIPGSDIPAWFNNQNYYMDSPIHDEVQDIFKPKKSVSRLSNQSLTSIIVDIPHYCLSSKWWGIAVCLVLEKPFPSVPWSSTPALHWTCTSAKDRLRETKGTMHVRSIEEFSDPHLFLLLLRDDKHLMWAIRGGMSEDKIIILRSLPAVSTDKTFSGNFGQCFYIENLCVVKPSQRKRYSYLTDQSFWASTEPISHQLCCDRFPRSGLAQKLQIKQANNSKRKSTIHLSPARNFDQPQSKKYPSDVTYQSGSFSVAFTKHEGRYREDKVKRWRDALKEVAGLSGWHSKDRYLSELTEEIVAENAAGCGCKRILIMCQKKNKGSEFIQGIILKSWTHKALWSTKAFSKICNLKLLMVLTTMDIPLGLKCLSEGLRYLEWENFPLKELPLDEQLDELVELKLLHSKVKQPWHGTKSFRKLKLIDLRYSKDLIRFSNVLGVPYLEQLLLEDCINLLEVDQSVGQHKKLMLWNLKGCVNLKTLPRRLEMDSLKEFTLSGCSKVIKLPEFGDNMENLSSLDLQDCKSLICLPNSIHNVKSLRFLNLVGCSKFSRLPDNLGENEALEELNVRGTAIKEVPQSITLLKKLKRLSIGGHKEKESNSWSISTVASRLMFRRFPVSTAIILPPMSPFQCLEELDLSYCNLSNESLPVDLGCLSSLWKLDLRGNNFVYLSASCIASLSKVYHLGLDSCPRLESVPVLPPQIGSLYGRNCASWKPFSNPQYLCDFFASHQQVRSDKYTSRQEAPFFMVSGSDIPQWFINQSYFHLGLPFVYEVIGKVQPSKLLPSLPVQSLTSIIVDIPHHCLSSEWWGIAVCLVLKNPTPSVPWPMTPAVSWYCKSAEADLRIPTSANYLRLIEEFSDPHLLILLLRGDNKIIQRHLIRSNNKIQLYFYASSLLEVSKCGCRVLCKEDLEAWTKARDERRQDINVEMDSRENM